MKLKISITALYFAYKIYKNHILYDLEALLSKIIKIRCFTGSTTIITVYILVKMPYINQYFVARANKSMGSQKNKSLGYTMTDL